MEELVALPFTFPLLSPLPFVLRVVTGLVLLVRIFNILLRSKIHRTSSVKRAPV